MTAIKLVLVDDHTIVTDGIKAMLIGEPAIRVMAAFTNGPDFFNYLRTETADVVLLDISLPGMSGIEIAAIISARYPQINILMLSALTDEPSIIGAIKAGAKGFLPKDTRQEEVIKAIKTVQAGKRYFGVGIAETVFDGYVKSIVEGLGTPEPDSRLSDREKEIVTLFAEGYLYKEIADQLNISIKTVESHKANIMRKLELKSSAGLIKYAIKKKLTKL